MRELAPEVWQLGGLLPKVINTYLIGGVLVDAGSRFDARKLDHHGKPLHDAQKFQAFCASL